MTADRWRDAPPSESRVYDGFISYSHSADDLLAPRLQAGLQKFAKPWWKRRAVRIFRDESSLAANPHLWSSITEALESSGWFVLLLSPDAASSEWVGKEIEHWKATKPADRILPVVTDGEFGWSDGDVAGSSVPEALRGVFSEEPRWVDLRFARSEEHLDLQNPTFSAAIADIASAIRGVPKDELESEEVRQHRRTVRTAWAAGALVTVLAIASVGFGVQSSRNATEAERQARIASENESTALAEADRADRNADEAEANARNEAVARAEADVSASLAAAREFAASAIAVLNRDPELATLLALHAINSSPTGDEQPLEVINALWRAGGANRLIDEWDYAGTWHSDLSPDGTRFAFFDGPQELVLLDAATGDLIWSYVEEDTVDFFDFPAIGPDGRIALLIVDNSSFLNPFQSELEDELNARVVILDGDTGAPIHSIPYDECTTIWHPEWSPDGRFLVVSSGGSCDRGQGLAWVDVFDTSTWALVETLDLPDATIAVRPRFDESGALHVTSWQGLIYSFEPETFQPRPTTGATGFGDVLPAGDSYLLAHSTTVQGGTAFSAHIVDVESGATRDVLYNGLESPRLPGVYVSRDGRLGIIGTDGRYTYVYDLDTSRLLFALPTGPLVTASYDPSTRRLFTTGDEPGVKVWDVRQSPVGVELSVDLDGLTFVADDLRTINSFVVGPDFVAMTTVDPSESASLVTLFFDRTSGLPLGDPVSLFGSTTGLPVGRPVSGFAVDYALPNGRFVLSDLQIGSVGNTASHSRMVTTAVIWDPQTGQSVELFTCAEEAQDTAGNRQCTGPGEPPKFRIFLSPGSDQILAYGFVDTGQPEYTGHFRAFDAESGDLVASSEPGDEPDVSDPYRVAERFGGLAVSGESWVYGGINDSAVAYDLGTGEVLYRLEKAVTDIEASPDRRYVASVRNSVSVVVVDTASWEEVATVAADARVTGLAFNADGSRLAMADLVTLRIVDTATGVVVQQLGLIGVADMHWIDDETIVVGTTTGQFGAVSLATDDFLNEIRDRLRRSFTDQECQTYRIVPCPTLDEIRGR